MTSRPTLGQGSLRPRLPFLFRGLSISVFVRMAGGWRLNGAFVFISVPEERNKRKVVS